MKKAGCLQKIGHTYYARVRVPRTLEKAVGQTRIRKSLHTSSRAEVNLEKHSAVATMKAEWAEMRKHPPGADGSGISDEARPADVSLKVAVGFIDHGLTQRNLEHNTIRDRLAW